MKPTSADDRRSPGTSPGTNANANANPNARPDPTQRPNPQKAHALLLALSLLATLWVPLTGLTPLADLQGKYTDHLRNSHATWVALHRGAAIYTTPFGEAARGIEYPQPSTDWLDVPYIYPPGAFLVYLPLAIVGRYAPLSRQAFAQLAIVYLLLLAHLAFWAVLQLLEELPAGARWLLGVLAWLVLMRLSLNAQYDAVYLACGVRALVALRRDRPASTLAWISAAALFHHRAIILFPTGVVALVRAVRGRPLRAWPWASLAITAAAGVVVVGTFVVMLPQVTASEAVTETLRDPHLRGRAAGVIAASLAAAVLAWRWSDRHVTALVVTAAVLAFVDSFHWWHAALMLVVPLAVGVLRPPRAPALARVTLVAWYAALQVLAWGSNPLWLFGDATRYLRRLQTPATQPQILPPAAPNLPE